uniref:Uncharacterized protein n=1 Tax=Rhizophora mucronata TaxID=61149 RepID=A0A2P2N9I4_RHIMU
MKDQIRIYCFCTLIFYIQTEYEGSNYIFLRSENQLEGEQKTWRKKQIKKRKNR